MPNEKDLTNKLLTEATRLGARLFRCNTGVGWVGRFEQCGGASRNVRLNPGDVVVRQARPLHAGLCKGGSDTIGWRPVTVTPEMVGRQVALFAAVELKTPGVKTTPEQVAFVNKVKADGGLAGIAHTVEDGLAILG